MDFIEILKVILFGIVEGITEWLPISSTGHLILLNEFLQLKVSEAFQNMFLVVIQLGAIMAVVVLFWKKLFPLKIEDKQLSVDKETMSMWFKIAVACVPSLIFGLLLNDIFDEYLSTPFVIAFALIVYGVAFILIESRSNVTPKTNTLAEITYKTALFIGLFQVLSLLPGTSRSGATILGAILVGTSRTVAAEFTFFLAIPTMFGASLFKLVKFGFAFTGAEVLTLVLGMVVAFLVSVFVIKFLMGYIKKHDFKVFGWYRIVLGLIVLIYFGVQLFF